MKKNIQKLKYLILSGLIFVTLDSCYDSQMKEYEQQERDEISSYLAKNTNLNFTLKPSGLYYYETIPGTGISPVKHDTAFVFLSISTLDGTQLGSNYSTADTIIFPIGEGLMIQGFEEGVTYMKPRGESLLLIPSKLAYGSAGNGTIPGYTPLLFDLTLLRVKKSKP